MARNGLARAEPYPNSLGYLMFRGRLLHRTIWEEHKGPIPKGHVVHHLNGDKVDNRIDNLSLMSQAEHCFHHRPRLGYRAPINRTCGTCGRTRNERDIAGEPTRRKCNKCRGVENKHRRAKRAAHI